MTCGGRLKKPRAAHAAGAGHNDDMWRHVGDAAREAEFDTENLRREEEAASKAERFDELEKHLLRLGERVKKYSAYRSDNCSKAEYARAQTLKKEAEDAIAKAQDRDSAFGSGADQVGMPAGLADVLDIIIGELNRFLVMSERDAQIIALWIVHTHVFMLETFEHTPHLIVWSQTHECGKSTLKEFIARLSANVFSVDTITGRRLEKYLSREASKKSDPFWIQYYQEHKLLGLGLHTLLLDEAEMYTYSSLIIRLMNSAHVKHGSTIADDGSLLTLFAPMAMFRRFDPRNDAAQITTVSRSVMIEMRRRDPQNPNHKRTRFLDRDRFVRRLPVIRQQISDLVQRSSKDFAHWRPEEDFLLGNRNADNWEPLIAIADLAGGHWGQTARALATEYTPPKPEPKDDGPMPVRGLLVYRSAEVQKDKIRMRIMDYLLMVGRCRRTEIGEKVLSNNFKAALVDAVLNELTAEGKIRMAAIPPGPKGGPWTTMVELAEPPSEPEPIVLESAPEPQQPAPPVPAAPKSKSVAKKKGKPTKGKLAAKAAKGKDKGSKGAKSKGKTVKGKATR